MSKRRIIYQDWIVDIGYDPTSPLTDRTGSPKSNPNHKAIRAVRQALKKLHREERIFIEKYYFQGNSYTEIATILNRKISRIEGLHRRSTGKLKKYLADFVKEEFKVNADIGHECIICLSPHKEEINRLIRKKRKEETWKKTILKLKTEYNLKITTPQILMGHQRYHMR